MANRTTITHDRAIKMIDKEVSKYQSDPSNIDIRQSFLAGMKQIRYLLVEDKAKCQNKPNPQK